VNKNKKNCGKLIVLDGLDGCGKSTQFQAVLKQLRKNGKSIHGISFPDYSSPSGQLIQMYLNGDFSTTPNGVNAYAASSFYAVDRYANYKLHWEKDYQNGDWILASRYTTSNAIHQMSKLPQTQWDEFLQWLDIYEYEQLGLPRPDLVLFLSIPLKISQNLLQKRYASNSGKRDIHESDLAYLEKCRSAAFYAAEKQGWHIIPCTEKKAGLEEETLLLVDTIKEKLLARIETLL